MMPEFEISAKMSWGSDDGWGNEEVDDFDGLRSTAIKTSKDHKKKEGLATRQSQSRKEVNQGLEPLDSEIKVKPEDEVLTESVQPVLSETNSEGSGAKVANAKVFNLEEQVQKSTEVEAPVMIPSSKEDVQVSGEKVQPPPMGANKLGGNIKKLKARKGSPFQPPARKSSGSDSISVQPEIPETGNLLLQNTSEAVPKSSVRLAVTDTAKKSTESSAASPNSIPLVVPSIAFSSKSEGKRCESGDGVSSDRDALNTVPPAAHHHNIPLHPKTPKIKSLSSMPSTPQTPTVLDLTLQQQKPPAAKNSASPGSDDDDSPDKDSSRCENEGESDGDSGGGVPRFSRMVPGCGSSTDPTAAPITHTAVPPPPMPTDRVVTGIDNPIAPPGSLQSSLPQIPANPASSSSSNTAATSGQPQPMDERKALNPPKRSATIGSEESTSVGTKSQPKQASTPQSSSPIHMPPPATGTAQLLNKQERQQHSPSTSSISPPQSPVFDDNPSSRRTKRDRSGRYYNGSESRGSRLQKGYRDEMARYENVEDDHRHHRSKYYDDDHYYNRSGEGSRSSSLDGGNSYYPYLSRRGKSPDSKHQQRRNPSDSRSGKEGGRRERYREGGGSSHRSHGSGEEKSSHRRGRSNDRHSQDDDSYDRSKRRSDYDSDRRRRGRDDQHRRDWDHHQSSSRERDWDPDSSDWDHHPREWEQDYPRDYMRDYYSRGYPPYGDPYGGKGPRRGDMFDTQQYYYYYYSQYYDQHPKYRDYVNQMYKHYQQQYPGSQPPSSLHDDRGSVRSGRSSVNDEIKKASLSASGEVSGRGSALDVHSSRSPSQRLTPAHFTQPHSIARFTNSGHLLMLTPSAVWTNEDKADPSTTTISLVHVRDVIGDSSDIKQELKLIEAFPGPLVREDTHKDVVVRFCESKLKELKGTDQLSQSKELLWEYLALLVKQNGKLCAADLASLLVNSANACDERKKAASKQSDKSEEELADEMQKVSLNEDGEKDSEVAEGQCTTYNSLPRLTAKQMAELDSKLTQLVCLGRRREAIEVAMQNKLWGHAMAIGSRLEPSMGSRVLTAFLHSVSSDNVLHTLVQQVNGKRPEVTKSYSSARWGDWRRHLATLVANSQQQQSDRDRVAIVALGDSLASGGDCAAAHLCYLIGCGVSIWGHKLELLGYSGTMTTFPLDCLQSTEVYEYGLSLALSSQESSEVLKGFQQYKLSYAATLAQYGYAQQSVRYCETIAKVLTSSPESAQQYSLDIFTRLWHLSSSLKYHHNHYQLGEGEMQDMADPDWLSALHLALYEKQQQQQAPATAEETADCQGYQQDTATSTAAVQQDQLNGNYQRQDSSTAQPVQEQQQPPYQQPNVVDVKTEVKEEITESQQADINQQQNFSFQPMLMPVSSVDTSQYQQAAPPMYGVDTSSSNQTLPSSNNNMDAQQQQPGYNDYAKRTSFGEGGTDNAPYNHSQQGSPQFTPTHQPYMPQPQYGLPPTSDSLNNNNTTTDASRISEPPSPAHQTSPPQSSSASDANEKDKLSSNGDADKASENAEKGGFFSNIFKWKRSNQVHLPDDKNPTIVWDEDKKKWVNKDGDDEADAPPPPPPMAASHMPQKPTANRQGPRKSRYVNPVDEKDRLKPSPGLTPPLVGMSPPPAMQQQPITSQPPMGQSAPQMLPPNPQMMPNQFPPQAVAPVSLQPIAPVSSQPIAPVSSQPMAPASSQPMEMAGGLPPPQQMPASGGPVQQQQPAMGQPMEEGGGQPMFFNPAQFQQQQQAQTAGRGRGRGGNALRRGGPQRRAFPQRPQ